MAEQRGDGFMTFSLEFITKTWMGKLKVAEVVFTLLTGACSSSVLSYLTCNCAPRFSFLDWIAWIAFINALMDMIMHLLGLWERIVWIHRHPAVLLVLNLLAVVCFFVCSSLAASCAKAWCVTSKSTAGVAAFFGFVCFALFAVEAFFHFRIYRSIQNEARQQSSGETNLPDYIGPPPAYNKPNPNSVV